MDGWMATKEELQMDTLKDLSDQTFILSVSEKCLMFSLFNTMSPKDNPHFKTSMFTVQVWFSPHDIQRVADTSVPAVCSMTSVNFPHSDSHFNSYSTFHIKVSVSVLSIQLPPPFLWVRAGYGNIWSVHSSH